MIRNLKALGLALCAVFAFGALSASMASAATDEITSPINDTFVTGTQVGTEAQNVFGTKWEPNAKTTCANTTTYSGTFIGTNVTEVEVTPEYRGCTAAGLGATVDDEGCKFVLTGMTDAYTNTSNAEEGEDATVKLNCGDTGRIKLTEPLGCTITFSDTHPAGTPVNQNLLGVKYDNELGSNGIWDVKATVTVDKIQYTSTGCGFLGITETDNDGFLTTTVTVKGYENAAHTIQKNLTVS